MKIKKLQGLLKQKKVDLLLAASLDFERPDPELTYFAQYKGVGILAIPKGKAPFLIVPKMEEAAAKKGRIRVVTTMEKSPLLKLLTQELKKQRLTPKKVAINNTEVTLQLKALFKKAIKTSFTDVSRELAELRSVKTKQELRIIKQGYRISDAIFGRAMKQFKRGKTETEIAAFFEFEARKKGCELAFPVIIASGTRAAEVHHIPINKRLLRGFCVIDFGIKYRNYCTDTTRTIFLGTPTTKEIALYEKVLQAQRRAVRLCRPGTKASALVKQVNHDLGSHAELFTHGLGHGFGIKIHEPPNLKLDSSDTLKENQVVTIEPGIYKNFGIRIEDGVAITKKAPLQLSKFPKNLIIVK